MQDGAAVAGRMTRMINALAYHKDNGKNKEKQDHAKVALDKYHAIQGNSTDAQTQRCDFLQAFESAGGGKGKDGLKWTVDYVKSASHEEKKEVASTEISS